MNNNRDKFGWKLIYFDAFAGSGSREPEQKEENTADLFDITEEDETVYRGSAERVVNIDLRGFDYYYFIESDETSKTKLARRLEPVNAKKKLNVRFRSGDANEYLRKLADTMKKDAKLHSLTILDPFGMQVNWESIAKFKGTKTDLWVLIPSGVIINRLLDKNGKLKSIKKLSSFYGLPEEEIKNYFYKRNYAALFDIEGYQKVSEPIQKITELYIQQLKTIFKEVTPKPLEMMNGRNVPIYHFAFAANNSTAKKIASQIIGKTTK
jgi:three-Cys-motif partner protein